MTWYIILIKSDWSANKWTLETFRIFSVSVSVSPSLSLCLHLCYLSVYISVHSLLRRPEDHLGCCPPKTIHFLRQGLSLVCNSASSIADWLVNPRINLLPCSLYWDFKHDTKPIFKMLVHGDHFQGMHFLWRMKAARTGEGHQLPSNVNPTTASQQCGLTSCLPHRRMLLVCSACSAFCDLKHSSCRSVLSCNSLP